MMINKISANRNESVDKIVSKLVSCGDCYKCCKHSSAFVLSHEVEHLKTLGVPLHQIEGVWFITPNADGCCPNLTEQNKCRIYESRPTSCHLFPFYMMDRVQAEKEWVLFGFCPEENSPEVYGKPSLNSLRMFVLHLESNYSKEELAEMANADKAISRRDRLEVGHNRYTRLTNVKNI